MSSDKVQVVSTGYTPRTLQAELHRKLKRFNVIVCHRRFGKTIFAINHLIDHALKNKLLMPRYLYVAPDRKRAKRIVWDKLKYYTFNIPGVIVNETDLFIEIPLDTSGLNSIKIQLMGAENPDDLKGPYYDGVIFDEFAEMLPSAWSEAVRPAVMDRGGWAIFIGTPKGKNNFYNLWKFACKEDSVGWFAALYDGEKTGILSQAELDAYKKEVYELTGSYDQYNQEIKCSWEASTVGSYYGKWMDDADREGRIRSVPWEPTLPVHTAWDLGLDDYMTVWFYQQVFNEIRLIRYRQTEGLGFEQWAPVLQGYQYTYGTHFMPHDVSVRELSDARDRRSKAEALGIRPVEVAPKLFVIDGIHAVRGILHRCWFDKDETSDGIDCLRGYRKRFDDKKKIYLEEPQHDHCSHGADGMRTLALTIDKRRDVKKDLPRRSNNVYDKFRRKHQHV